tara:strand:+ start:288 stop:506 length:219 start_codon:yes stop_codon:yes gene_type:complete
VLKVAASKAASSTVFEYPGGPEHTFLLLDAPMGFNLGNLGNLGNLDLHNPHGRLATRPSSSLHPGLSSPPAP